MGVHGPSKTNTYEENESKAGGKIFGVEIIKKGEFLVNVTATDFVPLHFPLSPAPIVDPGERFEF